MLHLIQSALSLIGLKKSYQEKNNYNEWPDPLPIQKKSKNFLILGVGGVLYPPNSVHHDIFNIENIKNLSLTADDIWLTAMLLKKRYSCTIFNLQIQFSTCKDKKQRDIDFGELYP